MGRKGALVLFPLAGALLAVAVGLARPWSYGPPEALPLPAQEVSVAAAKSADVRPERRAQPPRSVQPSRSARQLPRPDVAQVQRPAAPAAVTSARATRSPSVSAVVAQALADVSVTLCAKTGSVTMPDAAVVPIWGFGLAPSGDCSAVTPTLPGPLLEVDVGDVVTVTLDVDAGFPERVSLSFPGQDTLPGQSVALDGVGAAPGSTKTYTFTASRPGTFRYEAGTNPTRQVAMGLYGALVVSPGAGVAYGAGTEFDREAVLVLGEIDPALNADPSGFDLLDYAPKYWLINGKAYPQTDLVEVSAGQRLLFRYVNASLSNHTMELLGQHQRVMAMDAYEVAVPYELVSETFAAGQTGDVIVTVPSGTSDDTRYPLFSRSLHVTNGAAYPGGMLTFVDVVPPPGP